jgi:hypothetical protein
MKKTLIFILTLLSILSYSQNNLDAKIDEGNNLYKEGNKKQALKIWKDIITKTSDSSSTYGTTLRNILFYYVEENDEINAKLYYNKIINSKLNDKDKNFKLGEPYKNYRYHSTMSMASFYANNGNFNKALKYVNIADNEITYETTSLTAFKFQKVDLAFWKNRLYKDLKKQDSALYVLIKRAFEYDYKDIYKNWTTFSESADEKELTEEILSNFTQKESLQIFDQEIKKAIENLTFSNNNGKTIIKITLKNMNYELLVHSLITSNMECKKYLENSYFYLFLQEIK